MELIGQGSQRRVGETHQRGYRAKTSVLDHLQIIDARKFRGERNSLW